MNKKSEYIALLRGINVGGHHKVPMEQLRNEMGSLGFSDITTLLNSGNVIFSADITSEKELETKIANHLETVFGFPVPVLIRSATAVKELISHDPFRDIEVNKDIRLYTSFLKEETTSNLALPWSADDGSYRILEIYDHTICSVLDLSVNKTTKAMEFLEKEFGKDITTRNWNTLNRIVNKLS